MKGNKETHVSLWRLLAETNTETSNVDGIDVERRLCYFREWGSSTFCKCFIALVNIFFVRQCISLKSHIRFSSYSLSCLCFLILCTSCASLSKFPGVGRIKQYEFSSPQVPTAFDGFRIVFASDFHYKSKFKEKHLANAVRAMNALSPDLLLMGGDYQESCEVVPELFAALSQVHAPYGKVGVLGNNDYERCRDEIINAMHRYGMRLLEHQCDTLRKEGQQIILCGVRNPFDLVHNGVSPTRSLSPDDFVILLTHTPDYVEDVDITNTDLALAGHTHGGQITLLGAIVPDTGSKYGRRFLYGKKENSRGIPVIVTRGLGTSRLKMRFCAPSEIVLLVLRRS